MKIAALILFFAAAALAVRVPLLNADSKSVIKDKYIVVLHENTSRIDRDDHVWGLKNRIIEGKIDAEITGTFTIGNLIGFFGRLSPELLEMELNSGDVKYVECDTEVHLDYKIEKPESPAAIVTQTGATWGLDRIDQRNLPLNGQFVYNDQAGTGVDCYIIDTGILITHNIFGGRARLGFNSITGESGTDLNGHGTHVAGTTAGNTYGIARQCALIAVKVLSASGSGTTAGVIAGVDYVTNNNSPSRRSVANMSLGGGASPTLDAAVVNSINAGVAYAIAAGNSNANACSYSPARVTQAMTVGATMNTDARASFSNFGTCMDLFAPGNSITSAWIGSNTATNTISGTSMAAPHVCGAAAARLTITDMTPADLATFLNNAATPNVVTNPGTGSPNRLLYSAPE